MQSNSPSMQHACDHVSVWRTIIAIAVISFVSLTLTGCGQAVIHQEQASGSVPAHSSPSIRAFAHSPGLGSLRSGAGASFMLQQPFSSFENFHSANVYDDVASSGWLSTNEKRLSTFALETDRSAYSLVRRLLREGHTVAPEGVRIEEFLNYFSYSYPEPKDRSVPIRLWTKIIPTPWNPDSKLLHIGIRGYNVSEQERPDANLIFLIDVSGSMEGHDRLGLIKKGFSLLTKNLRASDQVAVVTYASDVKIVLQPTPGHQTETIGLVVRQLESGGGTSGAGGLQAAYGIAAQMARPNSFTRIILATDGDFNIGVTDPKQLERMIVKQRRAGVYVSVFGFGIGNFNDSIAQRIAQTGNGHASYIDNFDELRRALHDEVTSSLFSIADDLKLQIEFNPAEIARYRLLGYETRVLNDSDFTDDRVDAGEIGSGHTVTALYEIIPTSSDAATSAPSLRYRSSQREPAKDNTHPGEAALIKLRYKQPGEDKSQEISDVVRIGDGAVDPLTSASRESRFAAAVAAFSMKLRGDRDVQSISWQDISALAEGARGPDPQGQRAEFLSLIRMAELASN